LFEIAVINLLGGAVFGAVGFIGAWL